MKFLSKCYISLIFFLLYIPILVLIVFSFNEGNSNTVWSGFSLHWYKQLFHNRIIMESVYTTLLVSLLATLIATAVGTFAAIGLYSMSRRWRSPLLTINNIPMMNADIVTGVAMCLFFVAFFAFWKDFALWFNSIQNFSIAEKTGRTGCQIRRNNCIPQCTGGKIFSIHIPGQSKDQDLQSGRIAHPVDSGNCQITMKSGTDRILFQNRIFLSGDLERIMGRLLCTDPAFIMRTDFQGTVKYKCLSAGGGRQDRNQ